MHGGVCSKGLTAKRHTTDSEKNERHTMKLLIQHTNANGVQTENDKIFSVVKREKIHGRWVAVD